MSRANIVTGAALKAAEKVMRATSLMGLVGIDAHAHTRPGRSHTQSGRIHASSERANITSGRASTRDAKFRPGGPAGPKIQARPVFMRSPD